jgi:hypothetical protein
VQDKFGLPALSTCGNVTDVGCVDDEGGIAKGSRGTCQKEADCGGQDEGLAVLLHNYAYGWVPKLDQAIYFL